MSDPLKKSNPKEIAGSKKASLSCIPPYALIELGRVHEIGASKYGRFNWCDAGVTASTYYDAIQRHILAWYSGEETDDEDKMSHLSHIMACCAVLLDSQKLGIMNDDRPVNSTPVRPILDQIKKDKT
tara:strand:- start:1234 stop:1614 length:381 start_codon:yes stop_codon:yes gene_type:complete